MPYSGPNDSSLPEHVQERSEDDRAQWVEVWNASYADCIGNGGTGSECEQVAFRNANGVITNREMAIFTAARAGDVRRETRGGREWLVVPTVAIVEGVLNGEFVPGEEINLSIPSWNGRPVVIGHPEDDAGEFLSANAIDIWDQVGVGRLFNVSFADQRMRGEIWIDVERAENMGGAAAEALRRFEAGEPVEVSTAYWRLPQDRRGTFNGNDYESIAANILPDHLALLLDEPGACSWEDGCGAPRVNGRQYCEQHAQAAGGDGGDESISGNTGRRILDALGDIRTFIRNLVSEDSTMDELIKQIVANSDFTAEDLADHDEAFLQTLAAAVTNEEDVEEDDAEEGADDAPADDGEGAGEGEEGEGAGEGEPAGNRRRGANGMDPEIVALARDLQEIGVDGIRAAVNFAREHEREQEQTRQGIAARLIANERAPFGEEDRDELEEMSLAFLQRLANKYRPADYSAMGGGGYNRDPEIVGQEEAPMPELNGSGD